MKTISSPWLNNYVLLQLPNQHLIACAAKLSNRRLQFKIVLHTTNVIYIALWHARVLHIFVVVIMTQQKYWKRRTHTNNNNVACFITISYQQMCLIEHCQLTNKTIAIPKLKNNKFIVYLTIHKIQKPKLSFQLNQT